MLPWQVLIDQLICSSLSHTHYRYEVGMLKELAVHGMVIPRADRIKNARLARALSFALAAYFFANSYHCVIEPCFQFAITQTLNVSYPPDLKRCGGML